MGASLCCMRQSQQSKEATCPTIVIIKSPAWTRKRVYEAEEEEEQRVDQGSITLKDCLVRSPNNNNLGYHAINPTKLHVVNARSLPKSQVISSPEVQSAEFCTPRVSFSLESQCGHLDMVDERDEYDEGLRFNPILNRNKSQKMKKVSFRFPQEADIFVFYSPKDKFEDR